MKAPCVVCGSPFEKTHPDAVLCGQPACYREHESYAATLARQAEGREKFRAYQREYYAANRETLREKARERGRRWRAARRLESRQQEDK
jgi:protein-disulfide isomerase-like protein with CxxC motif